MRTRLFLALLVVAVLVLALVGVIRGLVVGKPRTAA